MTKQDPHAAMTGHTWDQESSARRCYSRGLGLLLLALLLNACATSTIRAPANAMPTVGANAVPGVTPTRLTAAHWIDRLATPDSVVLDAAAIAAQNLRLQQQDLHVFDLADLPDRLPGADVRARIEDLSAPPSRSLFDASGSVVPDATLRALQDALALDAIAAEVPLRFGLVTRRSDLRSFPTTLRVFSQVGDTDIDRFQESALFPGTPVAVLHASRDGHWLFVVSRLYSAWIAANTVATGTRAAVFDYAARSPALVVTGAQVRSAFTPEAPEVSELVLDMGVRLPLIPDWPITRPVNGQLAYASHVVALPARNPDGSLRIEPALVPRSADVGTSYLPLTRANLIRQAFKFLGERYGWGHSYGTRDCSGFVSEVYRSFGVELPRNTSAQAVSPAFARIHFEPTDDHGKRMAVLRTLEVGDLIYIPGHVMMVIGHEDGEIWLIHDTTGTRYRNAAGEQVAVTLNQVSVTPLFALLGESGTPYVDFITNIQRIRLVDPE